MSTLPPKNELPSPEYVHAMETLLQSAPGGIFSYARGEDDAFSFVSTNMLSFLGYSQAEFNVKFGNHFSTMVYEEDRARVLEEIEEQVRNKPFDVCEYRIEKKDGSLVYVHDEGHLVKDAQGKEWFYVVIVDITSSVKKQEEERKRFHQTIEDVLQANPDAMGVIRVNLTRNSCEEGHTSSPLCVSIQLLKSLDDFLGRISAKITVPAERASFDKKFNRNALLESFKKGKDALTAEYIRKDSEQEQHTIRTGIKMIENPLSHDIEGVLYSTDVSQEKLAASLISIMMKEEYDFIALLRPEEGRIEALRLSPDCPGNYRAFFGQENHYVSFSGMKESSALSWVSPSYKAAYLAATEPEKIVRELRENGHYEVVVPGVNKEGGLLYRKLQHYFLNETSDAVLIFDSDVTPLFLAEKKEAEALKKAAEQSQDIMDSIAAGIAVLRMKDPSHVGISYVNRQMFKILHFPTYENGIAFDSNIKDPLVLSYIQDACSGVHPDDIARLRKAFYDNASSSHFTIEDYRALGGDGLYHWLREEVSFHGEENGEKIFYATYFDVSEEVKMRQEREAQLEKEKALRMEAISANEAKSDFLSRMSHDIRTPLNGILGMTYLAKKEQNPPKTQDCLDKIDTSSQFLLGLINDILDMSRAERNKIVLNPEPYTLSEFKSYLDAVIVPLIKGKGQHFVFKETAVDQVYCPLADKLRTNQIFFNLLSNAVKYTPEGGTITYKIASHYVKENSTMVIDNEIRDTGIGMSEAFQKVLFQPFTQEGRNDVSETRGSGLGLSIVKLLVDLMGGSVSVQSAPGKGSAFFVHLVFPALKAEKAKRKETLSTPDFSSLKGKHILLCEDHPLNQEIARRLLEDKGMIVQIAANGKIGVEDFAHSPIGYFDGILMDIRMPVMDGFLSAEAIRSLPRKDALSVPIIAMTADAYKEDVQHCFDCGMNAHLAKPFEPTLLYETLLSFLKKKA